METLVLDSTYQPISRVSWKKAITLWCNEKVEILEEYADKWINSPSIKIKMPSVIRIVKNFFFKYCGPKYSKTNIFLRDEGKCQYCVKHLRLNDVHLDHVIPKSKGGQTCWENIVTACYKCNQKKKSLTLKEANMRLLNIPIKPKRLNKEWLKNAPQEWQNWIFN